MNKSTIGMNVMWEDSPTDEYVDGRMAIQIKSCSMDGRPQAICIQWLFKDAVTNGVTLDNDY